MNTDDFVALCRAYLEERYPDDPGERALFVLRSGRKVPLCLFPLPARARPGNASGREAAAAADGEVDWPPLWAAVIDLLEELGKRLKRETIWKELKKAGKARGQSTVYRHLADMHSQGLLTVKDDSHGAGFGLPEWDD